MKIYPWDVTEQERQRFFKHCHFKGGSTTVTNNSTYTPSEYELEMQKIQADYANAIAPNSKWLNDTARSVLQNSLGTVQVDFNGLNNAAQQQINSAKSGLQGLTGDTSSAINAANSKLNSLANGQMPTAYNAAMEKSIATALNNTMGNTINTLANRGVINSSVANKALNDISANAADTVAQQYQQNIETVGNLTNQQANNVLSGNQLNAAIYGNLIDNAPSNIITAASAQEAAQAPAINLWNASIGLNGANTSALAAAAGQGSTSSTSTTSGSGGGLLSGLFG